MDSIFHIADDAAVENPNLNSKEEVDPGKYAALLKKKLDLYCAAVALSRSSNSSSHESASITDTNSPCSDAPTLVSQPSEKGVPSHTPAPSNGLKSSVEGLPTTSISSREELEDNELEEGETEHISPSDVKRVRRMLSNRESARRSRRRKQAHLREVETQVSQLRVENSSLLKRLSDINQKYSEAVDENRMLKAEVETLRAKVKMAEEALKIANSVSPIHPIISSKSAISMPLTNSPPESTFDSAVPVQENLNNLFWVHAHDYDANVCRPATDSAFVKDVNGSLAGGKRDRSASMQRVSSLEQLQKMICSTTGSYNSTL